MALLSFTGLSLVEKLAGTIARAVPEDSPVEQLSRVERWANVGEVRDGEVRGWLARSDLPKPAIPMAAILGSAPAGISATLGTTSHSVEDRQVGAILPTSPVFEVGAIYRTVCVRLCDGAYFPVSFATTAEHFEADEAVCHATCGSPVRLFAYRNPGERPDDMVDRTGRPYRSLSAAFRFRASYDARCGCRAPPWEQIARDRHRLYALEARRDAGQEELTEIRERLAAVPSVPPVATPPPVFAAAAPASPNIVRDAPVLPRAVTPDEGAPESFAVAEEVVPGPPSVSPAIPSPTPLLESPTAAAVRGTEIAAAEPIGQAESSGPVVPPAATGDVPPAPDIEVPMEADTSAEPALDEVEPDQSEPRRGDVLEAKTRERAAEKPKTRAGSEKSPVAKGKRSARSGARGSRGRQAQPRVVVVRYVLVRRFASRTPMEETRRNLMRGNF